MASKPRSGGDNDEAAADAPAAETTSTETTPTEADGPTESPADATAPDADTVPPEAADGPAKDSEQPDPQPAKNTADGGSSGDGATELQQRPTDVGRAQGGQGKPARNKYPKGMVRAETGVSPEPWRQGDDVPTVPTPGADARGGKPLEVGTDTSGDLRHREGNAPAAAHGLTEGNGRPVNMAEQTTREHGGNGEYEAALIGDGQGAVGSGTGKAAPDIDLPTYPSSTITRSSSSGIPMEPKDVERATLPKHGYVQTSTDPIAAAAAVFSLAGDDTVDLVNRSGESVKPSEFFEVPDGPQGRALRRVNTRVSELYTVQRTSTPAKRLLFVEGQMVPVEQAELLITLHG